MADLTIAQHPPALKVGGRRLSLTTRPKPHPVAPEQKPPRLDTDERPDYPRPARPAEQQAHDPQHVHDDHEEVPKKDKKRGDGSLEHDRRLQERIMKKVEQNRPAKECGSRLSGKSVGGGGRIGQPAGKGFAA